MNKYARFALILLLSLLACSCAARKKATQAPQEDYPYQNAIEYRKASQKPVVVEKKGYAPPPRPEEEQNSALIFPGSYAPETGKGRATLQKLSHGDYYFEASVSYGNSASTFEGLCYQIANKLICPITYDIDEDFNPVEAYIELEQINPGQLGLVAHYTLPGLFGEGLPRLYRRGISPAGKAGNLVKPLGQAAPGRIEPPVAPQAQPAVSFRAPQPEQPAVPIEQAAETTAPINALAPQEAAPGRIEPERQGEPAR